MSHVDLPPPARRTAPVSATLVIAVLCVVALCYAAARVIGELIRPPSQAELRRAADVDVAGRWRSWESGRIFPPSLPYTMEIGGMETARRVGIGADTRCSAAVDAALATALATSGCRAVLRATYLDQPQGLAVTVGVVVLPDAGGAAALLSRLPQGGRPAPGLRALAFPGSVAARFADTARQRATARGRGPYVAIATIGYADGRPATGGADDRMLDAAPQLAAGVLDTLAAPSRPDCDDTEWKC